MISEPLFLNHRFRYQKLFTNFFKKPINEVQKIKPIKKSRDLTTNVSFDYVLLCPTFSFFNPGYVLRHILVLAEGLARFDKNIAISFPIKADYFYYLDQKKSLKKLMKMISHLLYDILIWNKFEFTYLFPKLYRFFKNSSLDISPRVNIVFGEEIIKKARNIVVNSYITANYLTHFQSLQSPIYYIIYHQYEEESDEIKEIVQKTYNSNFRMLFTSKKLIERFSSDNRTLLMPFVADKTPDSSGSKIKKIEKKVLIPLRKSWLKGADTAIQVINYLGKHRPDIKMTTFGNLPKRKCPKYSVNLGVVNDIKLRELYDESQILVITSRVDGIPGPAVEASLHGCAIVSTAVSGADEIVQNGINGFVVGIGDYYGIVNAITKLIDDETLLIRFKKASPIIGAKFNSNNMIDTFRKAEEYYVSIGVKP